MRIRDWSSDVCSSDLLRCGIGSIQQIASQQGPWRLVEFHNDAGVGDGRRKALVTGVVHDAVGIDGPFAWHRRSEERRVGKEWVSTCRSRWSAYHYTQTNVGMQQS